jgi:peptidoglycan/xylan/chitin deacetylase (PgdA/CDA1 family)
VTRAVAVTFDNLGDAADTERGRWTRTLPRILDALATVDLRATFFAEGVNAELNPDTLRSLAAAGHEVALHGWAHEPWAGLEAGEERDLLARSVEAFARLGVAPAGFRPPGGGLTSASPAMLRELGFAYCSPEEGVDAPGLPVLPFRWPLVDALYLLPHFAERRAQYAEAGLADAIAAALEGDEDPVVLVFHAFLLEGEERFAVLRDALARVRALAGGSAVRSAPCRELV